MASGRECPCPGKHTWSPGCTHTCKHGCTDIRKSQKHNASGPIYWTGRGKKNLVKTQLWFNWSELPVRWCRRHHVGSLCCSRGHWRGSAPAADMSDSSSKGWLLPRSPSPLTPGCQTSLALCLCVLAAQTHSQLLLDHHWVTLNTKHQNAAYCYRCSVACVCACVCLLVTIVSPTKMA